MGFLSFHCYFSILESINVNPARQHGFALTLEIQITLVCGSRSEQKMEIINDKSTGHESDGSEESSIESMDEGEVIKEPEIPKKKKKRGIVYISTIPKYMTVAILREHLERYASIGRVYLQAAETKGNCAHFMVGL